MAIVADLSGNSPLNAPSVDPHIGLNRMGAAGDALVTASDTLNLPGGITVGLSVDVTGNVKVMFENGSIDTIALAAGIVHPLRIKRVYSTSTTATGIHAYY